MTLALTFGAGRPVAPFTVPWVALAAGYVLACVFTVEVEFRAESRTAAIVQLPLALGAVCLQPGPHLLARLAGSAAVAVMLRRGSPVRLAFSLAVAAVEVAGVSVAVGLLGHLGTPGAALWLALLGGLLAGELLSDLLLVGIWRLLGMHLTREEIATPLAFGTLSTAVMTGLAVLGISAAWAEPTTLAVLVLLVTGLTFAYSVHRRVSAHQATTEQLYEFVKGLGPLHIADADTGEILEKVRHLVRARTLELAVQDSDGHWQHRLSTEGSQADARPAELLGLSRQVAQSGTAALEGQRAGAGEQMATPVLGPRGLVGVLTATGRVGNGPRYDMRDLRLLETVAAELATSLERGALLSDLGRAATTDKLTNLPNLAEFTRLVDELVASSPRGILVAAIAVDSFREVNETLGHAVGDLLLVEVGRRLELASSDAVIGRIGGGRFALALAADQVHFDAHMLGLGIRAQVEGNVRLGAVGTHVRLSVGVARSPEHGDGASTLVRRAETAMYSARRGNGGPVLWEPAYEVTGQRRLAVVSALREALATGAIALEYQPKVHVGDGRVSGVEALARWTHSALGAVSPDEFVPLAEATGLMGPLTSSVLRQALTACAAWQREAPEVGVSVNVSAVTVLDAMFVTEVAAILTSTGAEPSLLTLELTEGIVVDDPRLAAERMSELRALGVRLSVDDFGTGYSSLTYLKGLPVDEVKVDKSFVDGLGEDPADAALVKAVVEIAHALNLTVVAEGVELQRQDDVLCRLEVDEVQGYLHARPMPAAEIAGWLARRAAYQR